MLDRFTQTLCDFNIFPADNKLHKINSFVLIIQDIMGSIFCITIYYHKRRDLYIKI